MPDAPDASDASASNASPSAAPQVLASPTPVSTPKRWRKAIRGLLLGGIVILVVLQFGLMFREFRPPAARHVVAVNEELVKAESLTYDLGDIQHGWVRLDVRGSQRIDMGSYSKSAEGVLRNRLFVNLQTGAHRPLFADQRQLLMPLQEITNADANVSRNGAEQDWRNARAEAAARTEPVATLYQVIRADSNGDGRLSSQDLAELYLTKPDGTDGVWLLTPQPLHAVDALRVGDWLLLLDAGTPANPVLARFNLLTWQTAPAWPLPALVAAQAPAN